MRALLPILLSIYFSGAAQAGSSGGEAERFFRAGARAYESGQYETACRALDHAYQLDPRPAIAFSLAQAFRLRYFADPNPEHLLRARALYRSYLDATPSGARRHDAVTALAEIEPVLLRLDPSQATVEMLQQPTQLLVTSPVDAARVSIDGGTDLALPATVEVTPGTHQLAVNADGWFEETKRSIAVEGRLIVEEMELRPKPAQVALQGDAGRVYVDGALAGSLPLAQPLQLAAGPHLLAVLANGRHRWERSLDAERGGTFELEVDLHTTAQRYLAWTTLSAAAIAGVAGALTTFGAVRADQQARELDAARAERGISVEELAAYEDHLADRSTLRDASIGLFASAMALVIGGVVLWWFDEPR